MRLPPCRAPAPWVLPSSHWIPQASALPPPLPLPQAFHSSCLPQETCPYTGQMVTSIKGNGKERTGGSPLALASPPRPRTYLDGEKGDVGELLHEASNLFPTVPVVN